MKINLLKTMVCLMAMSSMLCFSCGKDPEPQIPDTDTIVTDEPQDPDQPQEASIIGHWRMVKVTQHVGDNDVDLTPMYGENFQLTFCEDGTLITSDGVNDVTMQWTQDGLNIAFIQAPGAAPVMYLLIALTEEDLVIENGAGSDVVTDMEFKRE